MSDLRIQLETPRDDNYGSVEPPRSQLNCPNKLVKESLFEFFGMYTFIVLSLGNVAIYALYPSAQLNWTGVSISWGLNLMFGIYMASFQAPAHLNPAVSLCMYLFDKNINLTQLIAYTLSQIMGALVAAATVYGIYFNNLGEPDSYSGVFTTYKNPSISDTSAFFTEFLGTALLVGGIYMLIDNVKTKDHLAVYIGAWLSTLVFSFGYQTAFAWNPARDLGPRILAAMVGYHSFTYMDHYWWIPLVGTYTGGVFGAVVYKYVIKPQSN
jgi:MIP family channel proteins